MVKPVFLVIGNLTTSPVDMPGVFPSFDLECKLSWTKLHL